MSEAALAGPLAAPAPPKWTPPPRETHRPRLIRDGAGRAVACYLAVCSSRAAHEPFGHRRGRCLRCGLAVDTFGDLPYEGWRPVVDAIDPGALEVFLREVLGDVDAMMAQDPALAAIYGAARAPGAP